MRILTLLAASTVAYLALAQRAAPPPPKEYTSIAEIGQLMAKARADHKDQPSITQRIVGSSGYNANMEYRFAATPPSYHDNDAEMFYVIEGSGTIVVGGKLVGESRQNPANMTGTGVEGGTAHELKKGDWIMVPEATPHWFSKIGPDGLVDMAIHLPKRP